jgi:hypothetical protein
MSEPEIVTREQAIGLRKTWSDVPNSIMPKLADTIELFAGLLEERCERYLAGSYGSDVFYCGEAEDLCPPCQRKAAALRRYRGE